MQAEISLTKAQYDREEQQLQTKERQDAANYRKRLLAWTSKSNSEVEASQAQRRREAAGNWDQRVVALVQLLTQIQSKDDFAFFGTFRLTTLLQHSIALGTNAISGRQSGCSKRQNSRNGPIAINRLFFIWRARVSCPILPTVAWYVSLTDDYPKSAPEKRC